jgi:DNA-directed RNA polymerase sigma subunit (sigma70/sigma32)
MRLTFSGCREMGKISTMPSLSVPSLSGEGSLTRYLQEIRKFPMLEPEEEYMLAKRWKGRRTAS